MQRLSESIVLSKNTPSRSFSMLLGWWFRIARKCNNCATYKDFSSNFLLPLFDNVIKVNLSLLLTISLLLCSKYSIRALNMINIWEYQNTFSSDLSSFKCIRYGNDILFLTNYIDLSCLMLSKNGVPSSSLASTLALTQVFLFLTYFPSSNMNSSIM